MPRRVRVTGAKGKRSLPSLKRTTGVAPTSFLTTRMPKFEINIDGVIKTRMAFNHLIKASDSKVYHAVEKSVKEVARTAQKLVAPGGKLEAYDTGNMHDHIRGLIEKITKDYVYGTAGVFDVLYAIYVHEGTYKMHKRPFLWKALMMNVKKIIKRIQKAMTYELMGGYNVGSL